jgi:hypothetical protein
MIRDDERSLKSERPTVSMALAPRPPPTARIIEIGVNRPGDGVLTLRSQHQSTTSSDTGPGRRPGSRHHDTADSQTRTMPHEQEGMAGVQGREDAIQE